MEAQEKENVIDKDGQSLDSGKLNKSVIAYLKTLSPDDFKKTVDEAKEDKRTTKKTSEKKPSPIRLSSIIKVRNRGILSPQLKKLYETKKELTSRLDTAISSLIQQGKELTDCEQYARALMKKAPKKFKIKPAEMNNIVRVLYESFLIPFQIIIAPEEWDKFVAAYSHPVDNHFMKQLEDSLEICMNYKLYEQEERKKAPGSNRKRIDDLNFIKGEASRLYGIMKFICALSLDERPLSFNQLIKKHKAYRNYFETKGKIDPELFTIFLLSQTYRQRMKKNNIFQFFDIAAKGFKIKDFRRTYLIKKEVELWEDNIRHDYSNVVKNGNAEYLTMRGQKHPWPYTDHIASKRDDMEPCDLKGNIIEVPPCIEKGRKILERYLSGKDVTLILRNPAK